MKMKPWMPLVMIVVMVLGMLGLMAMLSIMIGSSNMLLMTYGSEGANSWRLMLLPFMGLLIMVGLLFLVFRWLTGPEGPMPLKSKPAGSAGVPLDSVHLETLSFHLPDVSCKNCKKTLKSALDALPGVDTVSVDLEAKTALVTLVSPPTRAEIESLLKELGYPPAKG